MSRYTDVKLNISDEQKDKLRKAIETNTAVSIRLKHADLSGDHVIALTKCQIKKVTTAYEKGVGVTIKMSKSQLNHNKKVAGGFLPALLGILGSTVAPFLLKTALPAVATGALSGLASTGISKAFGSGGFYMKRGDMACKVLPAGQGLFLSPWTKSTSVTASGLYLKTGSGYEPIDGKGLLLGPNSPFQNIPILGMIL